jgi:predicted ester cyclase
VVTLDDVVAVGDRVTVRFTARGTQRGPLLGAAGTGRAVEVTGVAVHRLVDGRIAETWVWWDAYGLALRLGLPVVPVAALDGGHWEGAPSGALPGHPQ